ncbi:class I SAM-dependent methyltransferase [Maricaulis sp. CAU 1757]
MQAKRLGPGAGDRVAWDAYWRGEGGDHAVRGEASSAGLTAFWDRELDSVLASRNHVRALDAACGAGVVAERLMARAAAAGCQLDLKIADISPAAVADSRQRLGLETVDGLVSDAKALPLPDGGVDVLVSQFGIEYAGLAAFAEAARVLAPGGQMRVLAHHAHGGIAVECSANLRLLDAVAASRLLAHFRRYLVLLAKRQAGKCAPQAVTKVARHVGEASAGLANKLSMAEPGAARDHVERLLSDLRRVEQSWQNYAAADLERWLDGQERDLVAYQARMRSMLQASMSQDDLEACRQELATHGAVMEAVEAFHLEADGLPSAWIIRASKQA